MAKLYPQLNLCIRTYSPTQHGGDLEAGLIDLLVDAEPRSLGEVSSFPLYTDRFGFYGLREFASSELNPSTASSFALLQVASAFDEKNISIEGHLHQRGYRFSRKYSFDSFATVKRLATKGLGIAVLPHRLAAEDLKTKRLHSLRLSGFPREGFGTHRIYASFSSRSREDQRLRLLFRLLKEHLN